MNDEEKQERKTDEEEEKHFFLSQKKFLPLSDHYTRARKNERSDVTVVDIVVTTIAIVSGTDNVNVKKNTRKEEEEEGKGEEETDEDTRALHAAQVGLFMHDETMMTDH